MNEKDKVGTILSGATTRDARCQLLESAEGGRGLQVGTLLRVSMRSISALARIAEIEPFNAFFTEGDPFSEARRKGLAIPDDVARRYESCALELLCALPQAELKNPPQPGDGVYLIDPSEYGQAIFGIAKDKPGYIWFGTLSGYEKTPVPININYIPSHIGIFGVTGSGKSYDAGALIEKLAEITVSRSRRVAYPLLMVDAHADYADYADEFTKAKDFGKYGWVKRFVFPEAYSKKKEFNDSKYHNIVVPLGIDLDVLALREVAETVIIYSKGTLDGADLQLAAIEGLLEYAQGQGYESIHDLFLHNFNDLRGRLLDAYSGQAQTNPQTKLAVVRQLSEFHVGVEERNSLLSNKSRSPLGSKAFVDQITAEMGFAIVDFSADGAPGVDLRMKQFVVAYLSTLLLSKFTEFKVDGDERYLMFGIEEAQNFCPDRSYPIGFSLAQGKLSAIATQGRKFGLSLCLITQRPSFVNKVILSMCNSFLVHKTYPDDVGFVKSVTGGLPSSLTNRLTTLGVGELILTGQISCAPFPLLIRVPKEQKTVPASYGSVDVVGGFLRIAGGGADGDVD